MANLESALSAARLEVQSIELDRDHCMQQIDEMKQMLLNQFSQQQNARRVVQELNTRVQGLEAKCALATEEARVQGLEADLGRQAVLDRQRQVDIIIVSA